MTHATTQGPTTHRDPKLDGAIARAAAGLLAERGPDGLWRDFFTPAGMSDAWVSFYAACALAAAGGAAGRAAAMETWRLLECRRWADRGWGYHDGVPVDADTTLWGLALAEALGIDGSPRALLAKDALLEHSRPGGIATYAEAGPISAFLGLGDDRRVPIWQEAQPCVTAAAALTRAASGAGLDRAILAAQAADGSWPAYWWEERAYTTALAARALARQPEAEAAVGRAGAWARARLGEAGLQPFTLALLVDTLSAAGDREARDVAVDRLVDLQKNDGCWRGSAWLRVPRPDRRDVEAVTEWQRWFGPCGPTPEDDDQILQQTTDVCSLDQNGAFTTATALAALARARGPEPVSGPAVGQASRVAGVDADAFARDGQITVPALLDAGDVAAIRDEIRDAVLAANREASDGRAPADRAAFDRTQGLWRTVPSVRRLAFSSALGETAARLLGTDSVRLYYDQAFFKRPGGGPTPWHQDLLYWPFDADRVLTFWIPLAPVYPECGSLRFMLGSHRWGALGDLTAINRDGDAEAAFASAKSRGVHTLQRLEVGDVSAHHGWTVHGAGGNASGAAREAITVVCYAGDARVGAERPASSGVFERQAAAIRRVEREQWLPGCGVGDAAVSRFTPALWP